MAVIDLMSLYYVKWDVKNVSEVFIKVHTRNTPVKIGFNPVG